MKIRMVKRITGRKHNECFDRVTCRNCCYATGRGYRTGLQGIVDKVDGICIMWFILCNALFSHYTHLGVLVQIDIDFDSGAAI
jgi:hypothetical protein